MAVLWTLLPILDFSDSANFIHPRRFIPFVNHTLIRHQPMKIEKFRVAMDYSGVYASDVDVWLRFATSKGVEELELEFYSVDPSQYIIKDDEDEYDDTQYLLPSYMFSNNSSLVTLKLTDIEIQHWGTIRLKSLKILSMTWMPLCNEFFTEISLGSPSLELLELDCCYDYDFVDLTSGGLKKLVIKDHHTGSKGLTPLKIAAPNLRSLELSGELDTNKISLINLSSLVDAKLVFSLPRFNVAIDPIRINKFRKMLRKLLQSLQHIKDLTVGNWCLQQALSVLKEKACPCPFSSLVCLTVDTELNIEELHGIVRLLALTPLLETLVINVTSIGSHLMHEAKPPKFYDPEKENYWSSQKSYLALALLNLKVVKIVGFLATKGEVDLLFFLLKSSSTLKNMIIHAHNTTHVTLKNSLEVAQGLLSFPRCSHDAVILFT